jgi:hypothetical protein
MVEMTETAAILHTATPRSLILLDEVGRGTSTYDGLAIAWAAIEYIHARTRAKTLFATHYFELTELAEQLSGVKNYHVSVKETGGGIAFLRRVEPGAADRSYGIEVAKLAGLPHEVIERAREVLAEHESAEHQVTGHLSPGAESAGGIKEADRVGRQFSRNTESNRTNEAQTHQRHHDRQRLDHDRWDGCSPYRHRCTGEFGDTPIWFRQSTRTRFTGYDLLGALLPCVRVQLQSKALEGRLRLDRHSSCRSRHLELRSRVLWFQAQRRHWRTHSESGRVDDSDLCHSEMV